MVLMEENKEKAILAAAEQEFLEKGFDGARTVSIAERAGVTHAMLHYYYRTKEQLFQKIMDEKMQVFSSSVINALGDAGKPLLERLESGIRNHFDFLAANPALPSFIVREIGKRDIGVVEIIKEKALPILVQTQKDLDGLADEGKIVRIDAINLLLDIVSQNVFPFIVHPIAKDVWGQEKTDEVMSRIKEENVTIIMKRLAI